MAVNKNFVVKNGLEVDTNTLFVDSANNRVAIGTTIPTAALDVRGKILSDSQVESWVGKFVGIVTAGAVGVTTMTATDATVTGFSTLGRANASSLNVTAGFSTVQSLSATDITVGAGVTISGDINVATAATIGAALTVTGASKFAEFARFEKDVAVGSALTVTGISTFTGNAYFGGNVDIAGDLTYDEMNSRNINISGIATIGFLTATNAYTAGVSTVAGSLDVDTNLNVSGIATVGIVSAANFYVSGVSTVATTLNVGAGGSVLNASTSNSRVGINSTVPAYALDVIGDINSSTAVNIAGVSVLTTASNDATALAIALG